MKNSTKQIINLFTGFTIFNHILNFARLCKVRSVWTTELIWTTVDFPTLAKVFLLIPFQGYCAENAVQKTFICLKESFCSILYHPASTFCRAGISKLKIFAELMPKPGKTVSVCHFRKISLTWQIFSHVLKSEVKFL